MLRIFILILVVGFPCLASEPFLQEIAEYNLDVNTVNIKLREGEFAEATKSKISVKRYGPNGVSSVQEMAHPDGRISYFDLHYDRQTQLIWLMEKTTQQDPFENVIKAHSYEISESGIKQYQAPLVLPASFYGETVGVANHVLYLRTDSYGVKELLEIQLSAIPMLTRSFGLGGSKSVFMSPNDQYLVMVDFQQESASSDYQADFIQLRQDVVDFEPTGLNSNDRLLFLNNDQFLKYEYGTDYSLFTFDMDRGVVVRQDEFAISSQSIERDDVSSIQLGDDGLFTAFDQSSERISRYSASFSDDGVQLLEIPVDFTRTNANSYRWLSQKQIVTSAQYFELVDGQWLSVDSDSPFLGLDEDVFVKFVSNLSGENDNDLYALVVNHTFEFKKATGSGEWSTLFSVDELEVVSYYSDINGPIVGITRIYEHFLLLMQDGMFYKINNDGDIVAQQDITEGVIGNIEFGTTNDGMVINTWGQVWKCDALSFDCEQSEVPGDGNTQTIYHKGAVHAVTSNDLLYTLVGSEWKRWDVEIPENVRDFRLRATREYLFLDDYVLTADENGWVTKAEAINLINEDYYYDAYDISFDNGSVICRRNLLLCYRFNGAEVLNFEFAVPNWTVTQTVKNLPGTPYVIRYGVDGSYQVYSEPADVVYPYIEGVVSNEAEDVWQNEKLAFDLNQTYKGLDSFTQFGNAYTPEYYDQFLIDVNGQFELTLTNEHTWQERTIVFKSYVGHNKYISVPLAPLNFQTQDINDPPKASDTLVSAVSTEKGQSFFKHFGHDFEDPERQSLRFSTSDSIPGLVLSPDGIISGTPTDYGEYTLELIVEDVPNTSLYNDEEDAQWNKPLQLRQVLTFRITDADGQVPKKSSGGAIGFFTSLFVVLVLLVRRIGSCKPYI